MCVCVCVSVRISDYSLHNDLLQIHVDVSMSPVLQLVLVSGLEMNSSLSYVKLSACPLPHVHTG